MQGQFAKDASGACVTSKHPGAVCWCLDGALTRVCINDADAAIGARSALGALIRGSTIAGFNDNHTHAEVLALLDRAIAKAEAQS